MSGPTEAQLKLARRIAADSLLRGENWLPGVKAGIHEEIIAGKHDDEPLVQAPLAAIIDTKERAAKLSATWGEDNHDLATALRNGDHLK